MKVDRHGKAKILSQAEIQLYPGVNHPEESAQSEGVTGEPGSKE